MRSLPERLRTKDPDTAAVRAGAAATLILAGRIAPGAYGAVCLEPGDTGVADVLVYPLDRDRARRTLRTQRG